MAEAVVLGSEGWVTAVLVALVLVVLVMAAGACVVIRGRRSSPPNGQSGGKGCSCVMYFQRGMGIHHRLWASSV